MNDWRHHMFAWFAEGSTEDVVATNEEVDISHNQWGGKVWIAMKPLDLAIYGGKLNNTKQGIKASI
jgi:hypothetical protein